METLKKILEQLDLQVVVAWDVYKEALAVCERSTESVAGPSIDRRALEYTLQLYNDDMVRSLICGICARIRVDTGHIHSDIEFKHGSWLLALEEKHPGIIQKVCSQARFDKYYRQSGMPLASRGNKSKSDVQGPDFTDWLLTMHASLFSSGSNKIPKLKRLRDESGSVVLLCCPEDHECDGECKANGTLCARCRIPICYECRVKMQNNEIPPKALMNENWQGYIERWVYEQGLTWMEKTVASPYWTGITLFCIELKRSEKTSRRKDCLTKDMWMFPL